MMHRTLTLLLLLATAAAAQQAADEPVLELSFLVDVTEPESRLVRVTMGVDNNTQDEVRVAIPAWAPGAYRIVKYAQHVRNVRAEDASEKPLKVSPVDDQTWAVKTGGARSFAVKYDIAVSPSRMDKSHCYLAGPDTYFYIVDRKETPCRVLFRLPEGWKVGTGLEKKGEFYEARDYDTFIDCPTELGRFTLDEFRQDDCLYQIVTHAKGPVNRPELVKICRKIVEEQNRMFGGTPCNRFVFLYHFGDGRGGSGLEHLNSTNITLPYLAVRANPHVAASITSHEYFHLWNVKRLRPEPLGPFDYTQPVRTKTLWFFEGFTSYFGSRTLPRCGLWDEARYLQHLPKEIERLQNNPDRKVTSVEKASWVVWDRKDWPRVDYYNKGEVLGLLMDLRIRTASSGKKSLDDVMRHLYDTWCVKPAAEGKGPIGIGFPEGTILKALKEVSGEDWTDFASSYISGTEELPYRKMLEPAGLNLMFRTFSFPDPGLRLRGTAVVNVAKGGAAEKAGIKPKDVIVKIDGTPVNRSNVWREIAGHKPGDTLKIEYKRWGTTAETTLKLDLHQRKTFQLGRGSDLTPDQKRILDSWLGKRRAY